jgi:L-ascorbate metabolism protein UlaG (beta-lactamase superfamily)
MSLERNRPLIIVCAVSLLGIGACAGNRHYDAAKAHHTPDGFANHHPHPPRPDLFDFLKWRWQAMRAGLPREPAGGYRPEVIETDVEALARRLYNPSITWLGHASFLLQVGGANVLTDPHLTERASPVDWAGPKRRVPPAIAIEDLPHIDLVVISHNHYDHLDRETVVRINAQAGGAPLHLVPLGLRDWFERQGITRVEELDWWDVRKVGALAVHFVPAQHWSARTQFDHDRSLWGGWVVAHPEFTFYFAGDTGYSPDFAEIGGRFERIDLAALPIGAYAPRWFMRMQHLDPEEAVQAHRDLGARYSVAMHWGTFELSDESLDEPPRRLGAALSAAGVPAERFFLMRHGETRRLATP